MRQVEGAELEKNDWVGRNTWFGSVSSCIDLKKCIDVSSAFVSKKNTIFSCKPLLRLMKGMHGDMPVGHWVVMTAVKYDIEIMEMACAWI